ncbi:hypothetical protein HHU12_24130 [Flammeovirga aprica JL-4]|uniref:Uncharacterized protein n=2 Tax=Flammeovirga aprica TaxID=29528 RepID=A0A7X9RYR0_9BACT|nr:hypothetical protein [Flammeovirga aprica JL-4]
MTKTDFESFQDLVELHAGLSFEKQLIFGDVIGSYSWNLDMQKGKIFFGPLEFPIQIIGSLAFGSQSWMWGWANTQSGMPENLLLQSHQLKNIGQQKNIKEFTEGHFNVEEGFEHKMGMMACGLFQAKSYYCANYGQGTLVVTIDDPEIPMVDLEKSEKVFTSFPQLIGAVDLNHKKTFLNYLIDRDFKLKVSENKIEAIRNNIMVMAEFDELDRLTALNGNT